jgi:hypothetical protein
VKKAAYAALFTSGAGAYRFVVRRRRFSNRRASSPNSSVCVGCGKIALATWVSVISPATIIIVSDDGSRKDDRFARFLLLDPSQLQMESWINPGNVIRDHDRLGASTSVI